MKTVEIMVNEPSKDKQGYLDHVRNLTYDETLEAIKAAFGTKEEWDGAFDYFLAETRAEEQINQPVPDFNRVYVYSVTGSSEGDYIHIEMWLTKGGRLPLFTGKTFGGRDKAWEYARKLADILSC